MKIIKELIIIGLLCSFGLFATSGSVMAVSSTDIYSGCSADSAICKHKDDSVSTYIKKGVNILLYILGAVSVIVIIIAGFMYVTSGGDSGNVKKAKDMLLYAVVGIIVALLAFAIVNFVLTAF